MRIGTRRWLSGVPALIVCGALAFGCGHTQPSPPKMIAVSRPAVFRSMTVGAGVPTFTTKATSITGMPIDAEVVERLISVRMRQIEARAFRDLLRRLGINAKVSRPAQDLMLTIAEVVAEAQDGEARSQTLAAAVIRDGLSYALGVAAASSGMYRPCAPDGSIHQFATVVYEGLAVSSSLMALGFSRTEGKIPDTCKLLASDVTLFVDGLAWLSEFVARDGVKGFPRGLNDVDVTRWFGSLTAEERSSFVKERAALAKSANADVYKALGGPLLQLAKKFRADFLIDKFSVLTDAELDALGQELAKGRDLSKWEASTGLSAADLKKLGDFTSGLRVLRDIAHESATVADLADYLGQLSALDLKEVDSLAQNPMFVKLKQKLNSKTRTAIETLEHLVGLEDLLQATVSGSTDVGQTVLGTVALEPFLGPMKAMVDDCMGATANTFKVELNLALKPLLSASKRLDLRAISADHLKDFRGAFVRARATQDYWYPGESGVTEDAHNTCFARMGTVVQAYDEQLSPFINAGFHGTLLEIGTGVGSVASSVSAFARDPAVGALRAAVTHLAQGKALRRGDIIALTKAFRKDIQGALAANESDERLQAAELMAETLDVIVQAIREDDKAPAGIRVDVPTVATTLIAKFSTDQRQGWYPRATIGAGYLVRTTISNDTKSNAKAPSNLAASYYEELGVGFRCYGLQVPLPFVPCNRGHDATLLWGPHLMTSGLLFNFAAPDATMKHYLFVGGGLSLNAYRLLDLSVSAGPVWTLGEDGPARFGMLVGLQLPLTDYFHALSSGSTEVQTASAKR
jgi:hypothetical protein